MLSDHVPSYHPLLWKFNDNEASCRHGDMVAVNDHTVSEVECVEADNVMV